MRAWLLVTAAAALAAVPCAAQQGGSSQEAVEVARRAFQAVEARQWSTVAGLVHPETAAELRERELMIFDLRPDSLQEAKWAKAHVEQSSGVPPCVEDYFREQREKAERHMDTQFAEMFGGLTREQARALPPAELLARTLQARDPGEMMRRAIPDSVRARVREEALPFPRAERTILGHVAEGDSLVHVAYRLVRRFGKDTVGEEARLVSLKRAPEGWRLLSNADFLAGGGDFSFMVDVSETDSAS